MCGFTCVIRRRAPHGPTRPVIPESTLHHRGPDHSAEYVEGNVAIRHWRLSIVDLTEHSNQPVHLGDFVFVFNGELYDYGPAADRFGFRETGDTRTFLRILSDPAGYDYLRDSAGFYSFLRYDVRRKELFGGRDAIGKKPLFYYVDEDMAVFSSEERGILPFLPRIKVNLKTVGQYLLYKNKFFGESMFSGVCEIPPGATFTMDIDRWRFSTSFGWEDYYSTPFANRRIKERYLLPAEARDALFFERLLAAAVDRRMNCDVPVQIALSGGMDSTAIAVAATGSAHAKNLIRTVTVGFDGPGDESKRARATSELLGIPNEQVHFDSARLIALLREAVAAMGAPLEHPHGLAYLEMSREVRRAGKVLLTGEGADELFFGYDHYQRFSGGSFAFREYLGPGEEELFRSSAKGNAFALIRGDERIRAYRKRAASSAAESRELELKTHLLSLLQRNDRTSMAHSVEIRAPFLDQAIMVNALEDGPSVSPSRRKEFVAAVARKRLPALPDFGPKIGFRVPFDEEFPSINASREGARLLSIGSEFLADELGLILKSSPISNPRLGWSILNLGVFVDVHGL